MIENKLQITRLKFTIVIMCYDCTKIWGHVFNQCFVVVVDSEDEKYFFIILYYSCVKKE